MNVLVIETDSKVLLDQELKKLIKTDNKIVYNSFETDLKTILEEAAYVSMFEEQKYLVIKNASYFGKGKLSDRNLELFLNYLEHPNPYSTLIFTTYEDVDKRKSITKKILDQKGLISLKTPKGYELYRKVKEELLRRKFLADEECSKYIATACLNHWDFISNELDKLELYYPVQTKLTLANVKHVIAPVVEENNFKFVDAVFQKNGHEALRLLEENQILKVEPLQLLLLLSREARLLLMLALLKKKNYAMSEIMRTLKLADWQVKKLEQESSHYHIDDLKEMLIRLAHIDLEIKSGKNDKWQALELFLLDFFEY